MTKKRGIHVTGNWKMHKTIPEGREFVETLAPLIGSSQASVALAVPFTQLDALSRFVREKGYNIKIGAQNISSEQEGALTGEISAKMLKDAGASFVIIGHSERRRIFQESSALVLKKVKQALSLNLTPLVCCGETLDEREAKLTEKVIENQIVESLAGLNAESLQKIILAYEPVWAIGTGVVAKPQEAQEAQSFCRKVLEKGFGPAIASMMPILYGGSVKPDNAKALLEMPDIDGLLVGGSSLKAQIFSEIVNV